MSFIGKIRSSFQALRRLLGREKDLMSLQAENMNRGFYLHENVNTHETIIGAYSYVARNSIIHSADIGRFCSIGPNVVVGFGEHPLDRVSTSPLFYEVDGPVPEKSFARENSFDGKKRVKIGNDCWIGAGVFVRNGVTIGDGAVIGAGSVVLGDVPAYSIVVGSPAKVIRFRFDEATIARLQELQWWNWEPEKLQQAQPFMNDTVLFLKHFAG